MNAINLSLVSDLTLRDLELMTYSDLYFAGLDGIGPSRTSVHENYLAVSREMGSRGMDRRSDDKKLEYCRRNDKDGFNPYKPR